MRSRDEAYRILESALSIASNDVEEAEVSLQGGSLSATRFAQNQLHPSSEFSREQLCVRLVHKGRMACCYTTDFTSDGISECAQQVRAELKRLPGSAESSGLPPPQTYVDVDAYEAETAEFPTPERAALASRAITAALRASNRLVGRHSDVVRRGDGTVYSRGSVVVGRGGLTFDGQPRTYALANTKGLVAYHPSTIASVYVQMELEGRSGFGWRCSHSIGRVDTRELVDRCLSKVLFRSTMAVVPPGRYPVVLEPEAVAGLLKFIGERAGAYTIQEKNSFWLEQIKEKLVDTQISIVDDFQHPAHNGIPFDFEGVARKKVCIIDKGFGGEPLVSWSNSRVFDREPTGHAAEQFDGARREAAPYLVMSGTDIDISELIKDTKTGILVSSFDGLQLIDTESLRVVGNTAHGTFAIENGEVTMPLVDMRFDISILEVLSAVETLGKARWAMGTVAPPIKLSSFPFYSTT